MRIAGMLVAVLLLAGCTNTGSPGSAPPAPSEPPPSGVQPVGEPEQIVGGLEAPWSMVRLESGSTLISERDSGTVAVLAETQILKGKRFGNLVMVGSAAELPFDWMSRLLAAGPHPSKAVHGAELREFIAGAPIVTDATSIPSPPPLKNVFQVRPGAD